MKLLSLFFLPLSIFSFEKGDMVFNFSLKAPAVTVPYVEPAPFEFYEHQQIINYYEGVVVEINRLIPKQLNTPLSAVVIQNVEENILLDLCLHSQHKRCLDLASAYKNLTTLHKNIKKEHEDIGVWKATFNYKAIYNSQDILCLEEKVKYATEGYSDMESISYLMFDVQKATVLLEEDIFADMAAVTPIVEAAFRAYWLEKEGHEIKDYALEDIDFPDNKFTLPSAIGMTETDILFTYDKGEYIHDAYPAVHLAIPKSTFGKNLLYR